MRVLGIVGGMSWLSTVEYYRLVNEGVQKALGGAHSARLLVSSVEFQGMSDAMHRGDWGAVEGELLAEARRLAVAGAEALVIASNTMHLFAPSVEEAARIPVLHIADAVASGIQAARVGTIGLMGTRYSMEKDFYRVRLRQGFGIESVVPEAAERQEIHRIIFDELCAGRFIDSSREYALSVARGLVQRGAGGIVLGCTELPLIIRPGDLPVPRFDSLAAHAEAAVQYLLES